MRAVNPRIYLDDEDIENLFGVDGRKTLSLRILEDLNNDEAGEAVCDFCKQYSPTIAPWTEEEVGVVCGYCLEDFAD